MAPKDALPTATVAEASASGGEEVATDAATAGRPAGGRPAGGPAGGGGSSTAAAVGSGGAAPEAGHPLDDCGACRSCTLKKKFGGPGQGKSGLRCVMKPRKTAQKKEKAKSHRSPKQPVAGALIERRVMRKRDLEPASDEEAGGAVASGEAAD
eukprot:3359293-Prymnesium_polylepis.1